MIILAFVMIAFFFLFIGSCVFVCCALTPHTRARALSAALWCAMWGPCVCGVLGLAGLGLIVDASATEHSTTLHPERLLSIIGPVYLIFGLGGTVLIASAVACLHQWLIERTTFALFRIYAALVSAGIGSVFAWAVNLWMLSYGFFPRYLLLWIVLVVALVAAFGYAAYRWAQLLRGETPPNFTWIAPQEYRGKASPPALQ